VTAEGFPVCRQAGNPQPSEPKSDIPCLPAGRYPVEIKTPCRIIQGV